MKHFIKFFLVAILLMASFVAKAQNKNIADGWLKYMLDPVQTSCLKDENYKDVPYDGTELRAGMLKTVLGLYQYAKPPFSPEDMPEDFYFKFSLSNPYHTNDWGCEQYFNSFLNECFLTESNSEVHNYMETLYQGGQYQYILIFPALGIDENSTVVIYDEPNFRHDGITSCAIGKTDSLRMTFTFNTGYPFDQDTLKDESIHLKFYSVVNNEEKLMEEKTQPFTLLDKDKPLVAGIYDYTYKPHVKGLGEYKLDMSSTWNDIKRSFRFIVNDTLRAEAKLDKNIYHQGVDENVILNVKMDYDYPYIRTMEGDDKPTIRICYSVINPYFKAKKEEKEEETMEETSDSCLYKDTLLLANDAFANAHVNEERNIELPLRTILSDYKFTHEQDTLQLNLSIVFNDKEQYCNTLPFVVKQTAAGIQLQTIGSEKVDYYNISGQPIPFPSKGQGIYIELHGDKAVRKVSTGKF